MPQQGYSTLAGLDLLIFSLSFPGSTENIFSSNSFLEYPALPVSPWRNKNISFGAAWSQEHDLLPLLHQESWKGKSHCRDFRRGRNFVGERISQMKMSLSKTH